jgi:tetratricopeptide (TPR) repeat protein
MAEANTRAGVDIDRLEAEFEADASAFVPLARAYIERDLPLQAVQVCKRGLGRKPDAQDGLLALGQAYYHAFDDIRAEVALKRVLQRQPDHAVALRTLGEIQLDRKQEQKALESLRRSLDVRPHDPQTRRLLESLEEKLPPPKGPAQDGQPSWPSRMRFPNKITPRPAWHAAAQVLVVAAIMVGLFFWYQHRVQIESQIREATKKATQLLPRDNFNDLVAAEQGFAEALVLDPENEKALTRQAYAQTLLYLDHGQADRLPKLKQHLAWMQAEDLLVSERFGLEGMLLRLDGKPEEAEKKLSQIIQRAIEQKDIFLNAMVFGMRADAQLELGKVGEAREDYSRAAKFSGDSPHYQGRYAEVYLREGNLGRATRYYRDALRINPGHLQSNLRLAMSLIQDGRGLTAARPIVNNLLNPERHQESEFSPPQLGLLHLLRAELALEDPAEGPDKARELLAKSLEVWNRNAEAHGLAGRLAALSSDAAGAARAFAAALEIDPRLPKLYFDRAEAMFGLGQQQEAISKLAEFEKYIQPSVPYRIRRGQLLMRMDRLDEALAEFKKGVELDELSPDARFHVALVFQTKGALLGTDKAKAEEKIALYNEARQEYENTIMLPGGERAEVYRQMGRIYLDSDDFQNAMDKLAQAVVMMTKANEPPRRIADIYDDISKVFGAMGGTEGEKQQKVYQAKAQGLREGKSVDEVEKEWAEREKEEAKKGGRRRKAG